MQDPEHIKSKCRKCGARPNRLCLTVDGFVAERVHYGRPEDSEAITRHRSTPGRFTKLRGPNGWEAVFYLSSLEVIHDIWPRDSELPNTPERPLLAEGTDLCADCGESYGWQGLLTRCAKRHHGGKIKVHLK